MGSRTMPSECEHGYIYDWGDFGDEIEHDGWTVTVSQPEHCPEGCNDLAMVWHNRNMKDLGIA